MEKSTIGPPLEKILSMPMHGYIHPMYVAAYILSDSF